ncbi:alkaline phosphatase D family protein [Roseovarius sp. SYSU LYC5161]|uniref:alkaline phosphatase D family protein n=1 Tax=Roseovarius halophilus (ex Wu et al. 2025) TaxID=3376060 RepID=UPI00399B4458
MAESSPRQDLCAGPVLVFNGWRPGRTSLAALVVRPEGAEPGPLSAAGGEVPPERLAMAGGLTAWRYLFDLPDDRMASYALEGQRYEVAADLTGDLRIGYVSCNGEEHGDIRRDPGERNAMWCRLAEEHGVAPLNLLLHGGDQIYADEVTQAHALTRGWPDDVPLHPDGATLRGAREALRAAFFRRYTALYALPGFADLAARVPSLAMWDDHDICDGWGSLPGGVCDSEAGQVLFGAAREAFLVFQQGAAPDRLPDGAGGGSTLGRRADLPGLSVLAPDLRSERRRDRIMGPQGWRRFENWLSGGDLPRRVLLMSSVPLLGPRLSLLERVMLLTNRMEKYEDDLRDQWQSRAHRREWQRMLKEVLAIHETGKTRITALSGEIHLATHATMAARGAPVHQLVASGIAHRAPPREWAWVLDALARFGEAPLPEHPVRLHALPGRRGIYTAERNFLLLERHGDEWRAAWELEKSGRTGWLPI